MTFVFTVIGVVLILEGIPYFAFPAKSKAWAATLQEIPDKTLRIMGLTAMVSGLLLLYLLS